MFLLQPLLDIVHFLRTTFYYILGISIHIGRGIFCLICHVFVFIQDLFKAFAIIGDELYKFITELNSSIVTVTNYIGNSTNCGICAVTEAIELFFGKIRESLKNSKIHTRLLATNLGLAVKSFFELILGALRLISDTIWWLILLIPRLLIYIIVTIADFCIFGFDGVRKALIYAVSAIVDDVFRITITLLVLFTLWKKRHRIRAIFSLCFLKIKRILRLRWQLLTNRWQRPNRPHFGNSSRLPLHPSLSLPRLSRSSLNEIKLSDQRSCVVCQDEPKSVLLWPCRHLAFCEQCADILRTDGLGQQTCPLCRSEVEFSLSIYT